MKSTRYDLCVTISGETQEVITPDAPESPYGAIFTFTTGWFTSTGENMSNTMQVGSYATLSVQWVDSQGKPAKVDGPTTWASSDEEVATIEVSTGNPLIANVHAQDVGNVQMQATADADMGDGVKTITATCDITVISGEAVGGSINFQQFQEGAPPGSGAKPGSGSKSKQ